MRESVTLRDLDAAGRDVRAWCWTCGRGALIPSTIWETFAGRGWPIALDAAARRFRCGACRSSAAVMLIPATRPPAPDNAPALLVEAFFHGMRAQRKPDPIATAVAARMTERMRPRGR